MENKLLIKLENDNKSITSKIEEIVGKAAEVKIIDEQSQSDAIEIDKILKDMIGQIEKKRKAVVEPQNLVIKSINNFFKSKIEKLDQARGVINTQCVMFFRKKQELQKKIESENRKKLEELEKKRIEKESTGKSTAKIEIKKMEIEAMKPVIETTVKSNDATVSFINFWDYEIENENDVPRQYCSPDIAKIKDAIKSGIRKIDGVKIFENVRKVTR